MMERQPNTTIKTILKGFALWALLTMLGISLVHASKHIIEYMINGKGLIVVLCFLLMIYFVAVFLFTSFLCGTMLEAINKESTAEQKHEKE